MCIRDSYGRRDWFIEHEGDAEVTTFSVSGRFRETSDQRGEIAVFANYQSLDQRCAVTDAVHRSITAATAGREVEPWAIDGVISLLLAGAEYSGPTGGAMDDPVAVAAIEQALSNELPQAFDHGPTLD